MKINNTNTIASGKITLFIYGQSGIGKTTLAKTLPGKTLIISSESGLLSLGGTSIDYIDINEEAMTPVQKLDNLRKAFSLVCERKDWDNLFIDSLTDIAQTMVAYQKNIFPEKRDSMNLWGAYNDMIKVFIKTLRDLPHYNIIVTALDKVEKDEIGKRFKLPDMQGSIAQQIAQYFDEVFYYTTIEKDENKFRVLITSGNENIIAKDRSGKLDLYENPNLSMIFNKIRGV